MSNALDQLSDMSARVDGLVSSIRAIGQRTSDAKQMLVALARPRDSKPGLTGRERFTRHAVLHALSSSILTPDDVWQARYARRGAVPPADLTRPTWASELAPADLVDFLASAPVPRLFPQVAERGLQIQIPLGGSARIPFSTSTPQGGWVQEAGPIPVIKLALATASLVPRKLASISTFTLDLLHSSTLDVEQIVSRVMTEDLGKLIDSALVDTNPASALRPAGLRSYNAALPAAAAGAGAMQSDLSVLVEALNSPAVVFLCNPLQGLAFGFLPRDFVYPVLLSAAVPADVVIGLDVSGFISTTGAPELKATENALLHESDAPGAIGTAGSPPVVAAPARSLWQSACSAVRCIAPVSWTLTSASKVRWIDGVTW